MSFQILLDEIKTNVTKILQELDFPPVSFSVELAKKGFGDATCNVCFLLAKNLNQKPNEIAQKISENYQKYLSDLVSKLEAHPSGYLNFFANIEKLNEIVIKNSIKEDYGFVDIGNQTTVVVEHTSVNPNKALHIGHVRNSIIGDTLVRLLEKANYGVKVLNYIDDSGLQVADIICAFNYYDFPKNPPPGKKFDQYCGDDVYAKVFTISEDSNFEEHRKQILQGIEEQGSAIAKEAESITKKVLNDQLDTCWKLRVTYDCLNFESQIMHSGLWQKIFEKLKEMKIIELEKEGKNTGCWVIRGEGKDEDKVLIRSNGTATYIAKDIPYAAWKLGILDDPFNYKKYELNQPGTRTLWQTTLEQTSESKQNFTGKKVITVIDSRQSRLQKIITEIMSKFTSNPAAYVHLAYESVKLSSNTAKQLGIDTGGKQAQMSGRKGLYVNADSVLDLLKKKTMEETKKRNPDFDSEKLSQIANDIAVATIRYEMIKQDLDKIITFDLTKSLSLEGDTAPYIQYTYARAARILEKAGLSPNFDSSLELLKNEYETALIKTIGLFDIQLRDAANNLSPKVIAKYCYNLAVSFNAFYEHVRVLDSGEPSLVNARLSLVSSLKSTLEKALNLLGIPSPSRM